MPKITMIGAGSIVFARQLMLDILSWPELQESEIGLVDIDADRLALTEGLVKKVIADRGFGARVLATTDRARALEGADYVITSIAVGHHYGNERPEWHLPAKYGLQQTVADTLGVGGIFRFLRTWPSMLEICRDIERLAPNALLLNYVNPMAMLCWAIDRATTVRAIGLCHSVQGTANQLAGYVGVPANEVAYWTAGINHQGWVLKLLHNQSKLGNGKVDLYPRLREAMNDPAIYDRDRVRFEVMRYFGHFVTESSRHMSEYVPYFRRTPELAARYEPPRIDAVRRREDRLESIRRQVAGEEPIDYTTSGEYASRIILAAETDHGFRINGNVRNTGLITNLPDGCCVEVPCLIDGTGVHPCYVGDLPPQLAAVNRTNVNVQELAVKAALEGDRQALYHAVQVDPLASSVLSLEQMRSLTDELIPTLADWMKI